MMPNPTTLSEKILFNTLRIEAKGADGSLLGTGTGFFFQYKYEEGDVIVIVTNKHVVEGATHVQTFIHIRNSDGSLREKSKAVQLSLRNQIRHPHPNVDVCLIPCSELFLNREDPIQTMLLTEGQIVSDEILFQLSAMEDAVMVGYPIGLYDEKNNLPIFRKGTTATHPGVDFNGTSVGLLDLACFPGSSGSPVLILNEGPFVHKERGLVHGERLILLGIAFQTAVWYSDGKVIKQSIPVAVVPPLITAVPIHLTYYVKAKVLKDFRPIIASKASRPTIA